MVDHQEPDTQDNQGDAKHDHNANDRLQHPNGAFLIGWPEDSGVTSGLAIILVDGPDVQADFQ